jgi:hypothetical protein
MAFCHQENPHMTRRRYSAEELFTKLQQMDVLTPQGRTAPDVIRAIGASEITSGTSSPTVRSFTVPPQHQSSSDITS